MVVIIVFRLECDRPSGLLLFVPAVLFPYSSLSSVCLRLSHCLISFLLSHCMRECLGKHSCTSSPFPIVVLNGTSFFLFLVQERLNSKHAQRTLL